VVIQAGPPPVIFSPPACALSVWSVLFFSPTDVGRRRGAR
jgi:hypothetical protein